MYNNNININFGARLETAKVLEVTAQKIFQSDGIEGCKEVVNALNSTPIKATGHKGYRYFAQEIGRKIISKYPDIAKATDEIKNITEKILKSKKQNYVKKSSQYSTE